ncbi:MAG: hypothetical protein AAFV88_21440 [Planctomycetota bacterium]
MLKRANQGGGETLALSEGDDLADVPESHLDCVTDSVREAFRDPVAYFAAVADQVVIPNLQRYLERFIAEGRWSLLLAETFMMDRATVAAFQWIHPEQYYCMFGVQDSDCGDQRFATFYSQLAMAHWDSIACAGGIVSYHQQISVAMYGMPSTNPSFPAESTMVFGHSSCGDAMVCNASGKAGFLSHENGASYVIGSFEEMLDWIFGELLHMRTPEFDYSRC